MRRLLLLLIAAAAIAFVFAGFAAPAAAAAATTTHAHTVRCNDSFPLHAGSCGQRVADLQWLLAGHKPNQMNQVKPTFRWKPNGSLGARTKWALVAYRYRIGYPKKNECGAKTTTLVPVAYRHFFLILEGKAKRPACWVKLASSRVKAAAPGVSTIAIRLVSYELSEVGIAEQPLTSNCGPDVRRIQSSTGAFPPDCRLNNPFGAWCVSTQQDAFMHVGYGTFAGGTAQVYAAADWAAAHNFLHAKPKFGALVAFIDYDSHGRRINGSGHMGLVRRAYPDGSFDSIEGNVSSQLLSRHHVQGDRGAAFIYLPGVA